jgi:hypothetical protein
MPSIHNLPIVRFQKYFSANFINPPGVIFLAIYAPVIYAAPCIMFLMRADPLRGQLGGGLAMEIECNGSARIKNH